MPEQGQAGDAAGGLPPPAVAPEEYTEDYYRNWCGPHETWDAHEGREIDRYYLGMMSMIKLQPGERLIDLGAGRGELLAVAVRGGARSAIGVEYSEAAIELAQKTLEAQDVVGQAVMHHGDVRATQLGSDSADVVTLLDVVEHLAPAELDDTLREAHRLLAPGGRILIHTLPNRLIYDVTYRLQRIARPSRLRRWPRDPRHPLEHSMHVNEQSRGSLKRALKRAGFDRVVVTYGEWIHDQFVPDERPRRLYRRLAKHGLTAPLGAADIWGRAVKR